MTRFALAANETAAAQAHVPYVLLAEFDFSSGSVRVCSADRPYVHLGNTYGAIGTLGGIGPVKENGNLSPEKLDFTLSGVDNSLITTALTENYHGRDARLWVGYLDDNYQLVTTPQIVWEGFMDVMAIRTEQNSSTISQTCENRLIRWNDSASWLYTQEHQRLFDSTDDFFNQVTTLPNKTVRWNGMNVYSGNGGTGPRDRWDGPHYGDK